MAHLGLVGIGVMGTSFALNLAENGHDVSMLDRTLAKMEAVQAKGKEEGLSGRLIICEDAKELISSIPTPRAILVLVPSGKPLDSVIETLAPLLDEGDLIADLGNSHYDETQRRYQELEARGLQFLGMGISGGAEGARVGPSIMAGGSQKNWKVVEGPLKDAAAKFQGEPCCDWFGPGGSGHFIKMIHNGIEYADMQQIAEAYGIMRDGLQMGADEIAEVLKSWRDGPLNSYLIEIAGEVAAAKDPQSGQAMLDIILDQAGQKGTGRWSVIEALHLGAPASLMSAAVEARNISAQIRTRQSMNEEFGDSIQSIDAAAHDRASVIDTLEKAMIAAKTCAYVQGFEILARASEEHNWGLDLAAISRVWRAGCIIRSVFLDEISDAFINKSNLKLALAPVFSERLKDTIPSLRETVGMAVGHGLPCSALFAALDFHNQRRNFRSTANMIQGLRDYFGAHTFERIDRPGEKVNGPWHAD